MRKFASTNVGRYAVLILALLTGTLLIGWGRWFRSAAPAADAAPPPHLLHAADWARQQSTPAGPTRNIEHLRPGDYVLARDEHDPADTVQPRRVMEVFRRTSTHLRYLTLADPAGGRQQIETTDEHPFHVRDIGWIPAGQLQPGMVLSGTGTAAAGAATVIDTHRMEHPEGVTVYNLEVEGDHTYFASAENSTGPPVWVHNRYNPLNRRLKRAGVWGKSPLEQAAHLVPHASKPVRGLTSRELIAIADAKRVLSKHGIDLDSHWNGFRAVPGHRGTHTKAYFRELGDRLVAADLGGRVQVLRELQKLRYDVLNGRFNKWSR